LELEQPGRNYKPGERLEGCVKVLIDNGEFDASEIVVRLFGVDKASFMPQADGKVSPSVVDSISDV
jgi:hypothetical protein